MAKLLQRIRTQSTTRADVANRKRMIEGDHWLDGHGWVGPQPVGKTAPVVMQLIKSQFVYKNLVATICRRHRNGVVGKEPVWSVVVDRSLDVGEEPTQAEQELSKEAEAALTVWWDRQGVLQVLQDAVMRMLWAVDAQGRGVSALRMYIPASKVERTEDGQTVVQQTTDLTEAVQLIHIHAMDALSGGLIRDNDGLPVAGWYTYKESEKTFTEINALARVLQAEDMLPPGTYDEDDTVVQVYDQAGVLVGQVAYPLGGRLLTVEMRRSEVLLTESILSLQKLVNMAYTMMGRNVVQGGFLERTVLNAQLPGKWVNEDGLPDENGTRFVPDPLYMGAGSLNFLTGHPIRDEMGAVTGYTTPSITYRDPVPVDTFVDTYKAAKEAIYEEAQQLHVMIAGDAASSGESRIQATNDFVASLGESAIPIKTALRDVLETVLAWAAFFAGREGAFDDMRADVEANLSAVQPSPDEARANLEQFNGGVLSRETTMARNGVEDVAAEMARIDSELEADMQRLTRQTPPGTNPVGDEEEEEEEGEPSLSSGSTAN